MTIIEGRKRVEEYYQRILRRERKKLFKRHRKDKTNLFTALLYLINYKIRPGLVRDDGYTQFLQAEDMTLFRNFIAVLDEFLDWGANRTRDLGHKEIFAWIKILIKRFLPLGLKRLSLDNAVACKTERIELSNGRMVDSYYQAFEGAHADWYNKSNPDEEWIKYYYTHSKKYTDVILERVDADLSAHCKIALEELAIFKTSVETEIKNHLKRVPSLRRESVPFISFDGKQLLKGMGLKISEERSQKWLRELEYKSDGDINRSPFLKIAVADLGLRYVPIIAVFVPFESFDSAWIYHATKTAKRSTAFGTMGQDWGLLFEKYVRATLARIHPELRVFPGSTKISPDDFPEIKNCFDGIDRERIEVDVIAWDESSVYVISCKAPDMVHGQEMFRDIYYVRQIQVIKEIEKNLDAAREIDNYADCISKCTAFLEERNLTGKRIAPILVTSNLAPLANEKVRLWFSKRNPVPNVRILQSNQLSDLLN